MHTLTYAYAHTHTHTHTDTDTRAPLCVTIAAREAGEIIRLMRGAVRDGTEM